MIQKKKTIIEKTQGIIAIMAMIFFVVPWFIVAINVFLSFADMELLVSYACVCMLAALSFFFAIVMLEVLSDILG